MKAKIKMLPTPMAGLALAIVSLGWSWENFAHFNGVMQIIGSLVGGLMLALIATKFVLHPKDLWEDLQHPVVGSVVPTFAMGIMAVSNCIGKYWGFLGDALWLFAVAIHLVFLVSFVYHRAQDFDLHHMVPSWFVPPIGIVVANVAFSGNEALRPIANFTLFLGLVAYAILLPLMLYRLIFLASVHDAAKPTIAILAAPASLNLAGYLTTSQQPSPVIIMVLFGIAILMTIVIYLSFLHLMKLPFSPGYAAFTFPMVIGATALFKASKWMATQGIGADYVEQVRIFANIELFVATAVVIYVAVHYKKFISMRWKEAV